MATNKPTASNKYTRILGYFALVCLVLGFGSFIVQAFVQPEDIFGRPKPLTLPPVAYVGLVLGVLWLVVKAVLTGRDR